MKVSPVEVIKLPCAWDRKFLELAKHIAGWSKDPGLGVGAVIVRPDRTVCSVGYNGFPRLMPDAPQHLENREEKLARTVHAEINALLHAREPVKGYTIYSSLFSCERCFVVLAQAGIEHFRAPRYDRTEFKRWEASFERSREYAYEMNLDLAEVAL